MKVLSYLFSIIFLVSVSMSGSELVDAVGAAGGLTSYAEEKPFNIIYNHEDAFGLSVGDEDLDYFEFKYVCVGIDEDLGNLDDINLIDEEGDLIYEILDNLQSEVLFFMEDIIFGYEEAQILTIRIVKTAMSFEDGDEFFVEFSSDDDDSVEGVYVYEGLDATEYEDIAEQLSLIGVFIGTDQGFELDRSPTRMEGLIMLIRLLGKEEDAKAMMHEPTHFVDLPDWGIGYVVYAYKNGLTQGISDTEFGSDQAIQARSYITFLLRALGYSDSDGEFAWAQALEFARDIKLIDELYIELKLDTFLRDHVAKTSYDALSTKMNGSPDRLIDYLTASDSIDKDIADQLFSVSPIEFADEGFEEAIRDYYELEGPIYLEKLREMEELELQGEEIEDIGSLEDLKWFTGLEVLSLTGQPLGTCDFSSVGVLENLKELNLNETWISGDLGSISHMTELNVLGLRRTNINGDIDTLANISSLISLVVMQSESITGNMSSLAGLDELQTLVLIDTEVSGDLASISNLEKITYLVIGYYKLEEGLITGDLANLSNMEEMQQILFSNTPIVGNINNLSGMDELNNLFMVGVDVTGDISGLSDLNELNNLFMFGVDVTGDISGLSDLNELMYLSLVDMDVTGDISSLNNLKKLRSVVLNDTDVYGDVKSLDGLEWLEGFAAEGTDVEGTFTFAKVSDEYLDIQVDEEVILYYHKGRAGIADGTRVKELHDLIMAIDDVVEVKIWHDDGSTPSDDEEIIDSHNMTVHTDNNEYLVRINIVN